MGLRIRFTGLTLRFAEIVISRSALREGTTVEPPVPRAAAHHLHHGVHRPVGVRHRAADSAPLCRTFRDHGFQAGPAHGLVLSDAVLVRPAVGAGLRSCRPPTDLDSGTGRVGGVLHTVRLRNVAWSERSVAGAACRAVALYLPD